MNLTIDIGNTFCKVIIFQNEIPVFQDICKVLSPRYLQKLYTQFEIKAAMFSSVVTVPLTLKTDLAISLLANTISLTPGTVSAWLSADKRTLIVHALDTGDADALIAEIKQRYEAPLKKIFEPEDPAC